MKTYCLTYDSKNKQDGEADKLRERIIDVLHSAGAENITSPVATTFFFVDIDNMKFKHWAEQIENNFVEHIYYYLCLVANYSDTTIPILITNKENPVLHNNLKDSMLTHNLLVG